MVAAVVGAALIAINLSGCAYLEQPRSWGTCALVGGLLGAGAGAAVGIVIVDNTQGRHSTSSNDSRAWAGAGGAAGGAILGALAGHYICDPIHPAAGTAASAATTASSTAATAAAGPAEAGTAWSAFRLQQVEDQAG